MTKTQKIKAGLKALGFQESDFQPSNKYRRFSRWQTGLVMWVGKAGALRIGCIPSKTLPVSRPYLALVIAAAE